MFASTLCRQRRIVLALLLALAFSSAVVCASESASKFSAATSIILFEPDAGHWTLATYGQAKPGSDFLFNNQFYRIDGPGQARLVPYISADGLFEADRPYDKTSRLPKSSDVVQFLDKDQRFVSHVLFSQVGTNGIARFQGRTYRIASDGTTPVPSPVKSDLQRIEITKSAWQHIVDRHTVNGAKTAGASVFNPREDIQVLIRNAQLVSPALESNGYCSRELDAGHAVGWDGVRRSQTSLYRVITTQSGKLVTAYPILPHEAAHGD